MLKELILGQKVYAQNTEDEVQDTIDSLNQQQVQAQQSQIDARVKLDQEYKNKYGSFYIAMLNPDSDDGSCNVGEDVKSCSLISNDTLSKTFCSDTNELIWKNIANISSEEKLLVKNNNDSWGCGCRNGLTEDKTSCLINGTDNLGIQCNATQLINGTCSWNINKTLGVRTSETTPNPTVLLQDVVLAATSFVGTLIMIALIVMGVKYVQGGFDEGTNGDLKGNIKKLLIGLFLVIGSYTIIRLVQYVARGY